MRGLSGCRVLLVDDRADEALPLVTSLGRIGVGCVYYDGRQENLPPNNSRLIGVRLAFLDMDLSGGGVPNEKARVAQLVSVLESVLSPDNGPYIACAWTKHQELIDTFKKYIESLPEIPAPVFIIKMDKLDMKTDQGNFDIDKIRRTIERHLRNLGPLAYLQEWEGRCFRASSEVTNSVVGMVERGQLFSNELGYILRCLARAQAGQTLSKKNWTKFLSEALNPIHFDRMESQTTRTYPLPAGDSNRPSLKVLAGLNTMLHFSADKQNMQGAVFIEYAEPRERKFTGPEQVELQNLLLEMGKPKKTKSGRDEEPKPLPNVHQVYLELNPPCDHSQSKVGVPRLICGLLLPANEDGDMREKFKMKGKLPILWYYGPIELRVRKFKEIFYFAFSLRHIVTCSKEDITKLKHIGRLRGQIFRDIQARFSNYVNRAGFLELRPGP